MDVGESAKTMLTTDHLSSIKLIESPTGSIRIVTLLSQQQGRLEADST